MNCNEQNERESLHMTLIGRICLPPRGSIRPDCPLASYREMLLEDAYLELAELTLEELRELDSNFRAVYEMPELNGN